ncbi:MAG: HIT domain-containing protein [Chloroflexi bacterium]|nr:HIT domain-containing protein [Chloroflexota bacterium]
MGSILINLARSSFGSLLIGWVFAHASFILPLKRIYDSKTLVAFHHPQPNYATHIILIPKKAIRGIHAITRADGGTLIEIVQTANQIARELNLSHYKLIVNAGAYQEVMQMHFHLIVA